MCTSLYTLAPVAGWRRSALRELDRTQFAILMTQFALGWILFLAQANWNA
ncbi:MAG: hypothetical protein HKUEN07_07040 [Rhodocyclaceae bacterium]|nr:MAG: hypothetical protein HKUEN07_07040 [Rhodocyclaceae bacterium]